MKATTFTAALIASLLPIAPVDARQVGGANDPPERPFVAADASDPVAVAQERIDAALKTLEQAARDGKSTGRAFDDARSAIDDWSDASSQQGTGVCALRERLHRRIDRMEELARAYALRMEHVIDLRRQVIDTKLDRYLAVIHERALQGEVDRQSFTQVVRLLHRRAEEAQEEELAVAIRERLLSATEELMERGHARVAGLRELRLESIQLRLQEAMIRLQKRVATGGVTRADYEAVAEIFEDRARAMAGELFPGCS